MAEQDNQLPSTMPTGSSPRYVETTTPNQPPADPLQQAAQEAEYITQNYSYVTGGPNQMLINSLAQQSKQKAVQYKQNRADAENMYGQLTQTVDEGIRTVQQGYGKAIQESTQSSSAAASALGQLLERQALQRQRTADELGIGKQSAMTPYESDVRGNQAVGNILGSGENWANLLRAQQQSAQQQGVDTKTALKQSKNQTMMALRQALQAGQGNIATQIAMEQSKTGTPQLTPEGDIYMSVLKNKISSLVNPPKNTGAQRITSGLQSVMSDPYINAAFGNIDLKNYKDPENPKNTGPVGWYNRMLTDLQRAYSDDAWAAGTPLPPQLQTFAELFGLPAPYIRNVQGVTGQPYNPYGTTE